MTLANIDTFEHDIEHEMKSKEVTVRDIATSRGDIGNEHPPEDLPKKNPLIYIAIAIAFLVLASIGGYFGYSYYLDRQAAIVAANQAAAIPIPKTTLELLADISPDFPDAIGRYVNKVEKRDGGYSLSITSYAPVFAYMIKSEKVYADRVAYVLGVEKAVRGDLTSQTPIHTQSTAISIIAEESDFATTTSTSTKNNAVQPSKKPVTKTTTKVATTTSTSTLATSTNATSTPIEATTTPQLSIEKDMTPVPFTFSDITISNQNMRMAQSGNNRFYYAFVQNKAVVFSNSTDGILKLRDAILR